MNTTVVIDKAGRVVIPKKVREELHLEAGDALELASERDAVILRPVRSTTPLQKEHGVWVFRRGKTLSSAVTDKVIQDLRDERNRQNLQNDQ